MDHRPKLGQRGLRQGTGYGIHIHRKASGLGLTAKYLYQRIIPAA